LSFGASLFLFLCRESFPSDKLRAPSRFPDEQLLPSETRGSSGLSCRFRRCVSFLSRFRGVSGVAEVCRSLLCGFPEDFLVVTAIAHSANVCSFLIFRRWSPMRRFQGLPIASAHPPLLPPPNPVSAPLISPPRHQIAFSFEQARRRYFWRGGFFLLEVWSFLLRCFLSLTLTRF